MKKLFILIFILVLIVVLSISSLAVNLDLLNVQEIDTIAQLTLGQMAEREAINRKIAGGIPLGLGGCALILGVSTNNNDLQIASFIVGGVLASAGFLRLAIKSSTEKEYHKVKKYPKDLQESIAMNSLNYLAERAKKERITRAITSISSGLFIMYNPSSDNEIERNALIPIAIGVYHLLNKSHIEKTYEQIREIKLNVNNIKNAYTVSYSFRF